MRRAAVRATLSLPPTKASGREAIMRLPEYQGPAPAAGGTRSCNEPSKAREAPQSGELETSVMLHAYRRARWIISRTVISFGWRSQTLLPLFQFDEADMSPRPSIAAVVRELADVFDDWQLAVWFAQPNGRLCYAAPVDAIARDVPAVLSPARAERLLARGSHSP
jgi:hypothetical protein